MAGRITRVKLKDYRSIGACDVELQPFTLLVGPNGAGKSNFLDSLRFLVHSIHAPLEQVVEARSGMRGILRKLPGGQSAPRFAITVECDLGDGTCGTYSLTVAAGPNGGAVIENEQYRAGEFQSSPLGVAPRQSLAALDGHREYGALFKAIAGMTFYSPIPGKIRRPVAAGPGTVLWPDASNAADVLARLQRERPQTMERIRGYVQSFNPEFQDLAVTTVENFRLITFVPSMNPSAWRLNSSDVSDGTLRALAILLAVFQAAGEGAPVSLVGLEEPENNLHPAAAGVLLDALLEGSREAPVIASTHSADLLDREDLPAESLLAVALENGETVIGPIDDAGRSILQQHLYTAGELLRSNQLMPNRALGTTK